MGSNNRAASGGGQKKKVRKAKNVGRSDARTELAGMRTRPPEAIRRPKRFIEDCFGGENVKNPQPMKKSKSQISKTTASIAQSIGTYRAANDPWLSPERFRNRQQTTTITAPVQIGDASPGQRTSPRSEDDETRVLSSRLENRYRRYQVSPFSPGSSQQSAIGDLFRNRWPTTRVNPVPQAGAVVENGCFGQSPPKKKKKKSSGGERQTSAPAPGSWRAIHSQPMLRITMRSPSTILSAQRVTATEESSPNRFDRLSSAISSTDFSAGQRSLDEAGHTSDEDNGVGSASGTGSSNGSLFVNAWDKATVDAAKHSALPGRRGKIFTSVLNNVENGGNRVCVKLKLSASATTLRAKKASEAGQRKIKAKLFENSVTMAAANKKIPFAKRLHSRRGLSQEESQEESDADWTPDSDESEGSESIDAEDELHDSFVQGPAPPSDDDAVFDSDAYGYDTDNSSDSDWVDIEPGEARSNGGFSQQYDGPHDPLVILRPGEGLIQRNSLPTVPPFASEYETELEEEKLLWKTEPPTAAQISEWAKEYLCTADENTSLSPEALAIADPKNPHILWASIFTGDLIQKLVDYTNERGQSEFDQRMEQFLLWEQRLHRKGPDAAGKRPDDLEQWVPVTVVEMRAYLGACLYIGEQKLNDVPLDDLFSVDHWSSNPLLLLAFERDRFRQLKRYICFDSLSNRKETTEEELEGNKAKFLKIRELFEPITANCGRLFTPSKYLCVDESMIDFKGRFCGKVYTKMKKTQWGIKIWTLCDARTHVPLVMFMYMGKGKGQLREQDQGFKIVNKLCEKYRFTGRIITVDRYFTSVKLAKHLRENGLHLVGTLQTNRKGIPSIFKKFKFSDCPAKIEESRKAAAAKAAQQAEKAAEEAAGVARAAKAKHQTTRQSSDPSASQPPASVDSASASSQVTAEAASPVAAVPVASTLDPSVYRRAVKESDHLLANLRVFLGMPPVSSRAPKDAKECQAGFLFNDDLTFGVYEDPKKTSKPNVFFLSTLHHDCSVSDREKSKPLPILFYNKNKPGVDTVDQCLGYYTSRQRGRRWPRRVLFYLLDLACYSSYKAFVMANSQLGSKPWTRRHYIKSIAVWLLEPLIEQRVNVPSSKIRKLVRLLRASDEVASLNSFRRKYRIKLSVLGDVQDPKFITPRKRKAFKKQLASEQVSLGSTKRRKLNVREGERDPVQGPCYFAYCRKNSRKSRQRCQRCNEWVCAEHGPREQKTVHGTSRKQPLAYCRPFGGICCNSKIPYIEASRLCQDFNSFLDDNFWSVQ